MRTQVEIEYAIRSALDTGEQAMSEGNDGVVAVAAAIADALRWVQGHDDTAFQVFMDVALKLDARN